MKRDELTAQQVVNTVQNALQAANNRKRYATLYALQQVKTAALQREQKRPLSCLPTEKLQDRLAYNVQLVKVLAEIDTLSHDLSSAAFGTPWAATVWFLHGRVLNSSRQGQKGLTVQLLRYVSPTASGPNNTAYQATTDAAGYFIIRDDSAPLQCDPQTTCFGLNVLDAAGKQVFQDTCLFKFRGGMVDYREIVLP